MNSTIFQVHRPNLIMEMNLFMDGDGIPLSLSIHSGSTIEQLTLQWLKIRYLRTFLGISL